MRNIFILLIQIIQIIQMWNTVALSFYVIWLKPNILVSNFLIEKNSIIYRDYKIWSCSKDFSHKIRRLHLHSSRHKQTRHEKRFKSSSVKWSDNLILEKLSWKCSADFRFENYFQKYWKFWLNEFSCSYDSIFDFFKWVS